jgi:hypothetical protein
MYFCSGIVMSLTYWNCLPSPICHIDIKLKGDLIHSATCFHGFSQHNCPYNGSNLLDLVCSNVDLLVDYTEYDVVQPEHFHPPLTLTAIRHYKQNFNISYKRFSTGDCAVLYNALSIYDCSLL